MFFIYIICVAPNRFCHAVEKGAHGLGQSRQLGPPWAGRVRRWVRDVLLDDEGGEVVWWGQKSTHIENVWKLELKPLYWDIKVRDHGLDHHPGWMGDGDGTEEQMWG